MTNNELILQVRTNFSRIYLGGIPSLLSDEGAFLSFICTLTAVEALGGFVRPAGKNWERFKGFIREYFAVPYPDHADDLWKLRNAAVHGFTPGPYALTHHKSRLHLTTGSFPTGPDRIILNAEDFYSELMQAARRYFNALDGDNDLQEAFVKRANDHDTGILIVTSASGTVR